MPPMPSSIAIQTFAGGAYCGALAMYALINGLRVYRHRKAKKELDKLTKQVLDHIFGSIPAPKPPQPEEMKRVVLTKEMQDRGPIPDVPAIKWTDHAIRMLVERNGLNPDMPINVNLNKLNGEIIFEQPASFSRGRSHAN